MSAFSSHTHAHTCIHTTTVRMLQAFVYMVGGGNYIEYQNLQDYCKRQQSSKTITYGASELMNAGNFLEQVKKILIIAAVKSKIINCFLLLQLSELGEHTQ